MWVSCSLQEREFSWSQQTAFCTGSYNQAMKLLVLIIPAKPSLTMNLIYFVTEFPLAAKIFHGYVLALTALS